MSDSLEGLDFYKVLEVSKDATETEIRSSYRKLARKWHPDRNLDNQEKAAVNFKRVTKAYEVLTDAAKRKIYDVHGEKGLDQQGGPGHGGRDPMDVFNHLFGFGFGGQQHHHQQGPRKTEDMVYAISLSLREFYKGKVRRLQITKDMICGACRGSGSKNPNAGDTTCPTCRGSGAEERIVQTSIIMQRIRTTCSRCQGQGSVIAEQDRCGGCHGGKLVKQKFTEEVTIRPGMRPGDKITLYGEANQAPGCEAGDIILVLKERQVGDAHGVGTSDEVERQFERRGDDLLIRQTLTLSEALCGYRRQVQHLDDRWIEINSPEGAPVVKPGDVHYIEGEGMPCTANPAIKGYLLVQFDVEMPTAAQLDGEARAVLLKILPPGRTFVPRPDAEEHYALVGSADTSSSDHRRGKDATSAGGRDDDDMGAGAGGGVRCAQQ